MKRKNDSINDNEPKTKKRKLDNKALAKNLKSECVHQGKWLKSVEITYVDEKNVTRKWESVERTTRPSCGVDGIEIIATVKYTDRPDKLVLVKQYRPPLGQYCIEFPAGLVDENESISESALRELKEETGYIGKVDHISPYVCLEPGLSNANAKIVIISIDGDTEANQNPQQHLEQTENIEVRLVSKKKVMGELNILSKKGYFIDSKLYTFALNFM